MPTKALLIAASSFRFIVASQTAKAIADAIAMNVAAPASRSERRGQACGRSPTPIRKPISHALKANHVKICIMRLQAPLGADSTRRHHPAATAQTSTRPVQFKVAVAPVHCNAESPKFFQA